MKGVTATAFIFLLSANLLGQSPNSKDASAIEKHPRTIAEKALECIQIATILQTDWTEVEAQFELFSDYYRTTQVKLSLLPDDRIEIATKESSRSREKRITLNGVQEKARVQEILTGLLPVVRAYARMYKQGKPLELPSPEMLNALSPEGAIAGTSLIFEVMVKDQSGQSFDHSFHFYHLKGREGQRFVDSVKSLTEMAGTPN